MSNNRLIWKMKFNVAKYQSRTLKQNTILTTHYISKHWTCRRWRNTSNVGDMLAFGVAIPGGPQGAVLLNLLLQEHSGTPFLEKTNKYLTPAPNLRRTRASRDSQYTRYLANSDALNNSFFPRNIPLWNSFPFSVVSSFAYTGICYSHIENIHEDA